MKKLLMIPLLVLTVAACEDGGYLSDTPQGKSDSVMRLEAAGNDLRVYEFTPMTAKNKQCVFVAGERKAGLVCFDKE